MRLFGDLTLIMAEDDQHVGIVVAYMSSTITMAVLSDLTERQKNPVGYKRVQA